MLLTAVPGLVLRPWSHLLQLLGPFQEVHPHPPPALASAQQGSCRGLSQAPSEGLVWAWVEGVAAVPEPQGHYAGPAQQLNRQRAVAAPLTDQQAPRCCTAAVQLLYRLLLLLLLLLAWEGTPCAACLG